MPTPDIRNELQQLVDFIATRSGYSGEPISPSVMKQIEIEVRDNGAGILVPNWFSVLQNGRGPRKSTKDHGLWKRIYAWMEKNNMFKTRTAKGKINEAKSMTWFINKYGNEQFRKRVYVEVYAQAREQCITDVIKKYGEMEFKITKNIL